MQSSPTSPSLSSHPQLRAKKSRGLVGWLSCFLATGLSAATLQYDSDGTGNITDGNASGWNTTATNKPWYDSTSMTYLAWPNTNADIAIFGGGISGTAGSVAVGSVIANGILFNAPFAGSYTLSGGTITLDGTTPTITANVNATITSALAGSVGLTKNGTGTLTLSGAAANTYGGGTSVLAGNLTMSKTAGVNAVGGDVIINGGTLIWGGANQVPDTASVTLISGGLQITGNTETIANLTIQGGNSNANTSSNGGLFTITNTLAINGTGSLGLNSAGQWTVNKADFTGAAASAFGMTGNNNTRITQLNIGSGGLILSGQNLAINKGSTAAALGSEIVFNGGVTASGTNNFNTGGTFGSSRISLPIISTWDITAGTTNINVATIGVGGLIKTGAGNLALAGAEANTHSGMTTVSGGSLLLGKTAGVNAIAGDITVATGGILDWNTANQLADTTHIFLIGGSLKFDNLTETFANLTQTAGTVNIGGNTNSGIVNITGLLRVSGGTSINLNSGAIWSVGGADFTGFSGTVVSLNGNSTTGLNQFIIGSGGLILTGQSINLAKGTAVGAFGSELAINGNVTASGTNSINAGANTIGVSQVNLGAADRTWNITSGTTSSNSSVVSSGGGIVKTGNGILALNAANTYTGNTTINEGSVRLGASASVDNSPIISVASGATFDVVAVTGGYSVKSSQLLQGGGSVAGATTIASGGTLAPGTVGGDFLQKLSFSSSLILATGSQTRLQLSNSSGDYDQIAVTGTFTQQTGGQIIVEPGDFVPTAGQSFNLFDWGTLGSLSSNLGSNYRDGSDDDATDLNLPNIAGSGFFWDISQFASSGIITVVVPEPSRSLLLMIAGLALVSRRRR
ncbi:autotransporter-associated beta strand repeat-containing protein [Prosthecobacter dejongeii]|uniref:Autotransporter-associated beta strand protein n=1 Tax=Prosthecobacter dejongeii TaxID=48465 RepID=A0A7W8DP06_9BACT|nr:autotransporter-associated beta strand repeat-containing protein [Prosthecobacter dejongeii]MBB5036635.1 autotransporter-associated beta strand protein [Prosthecobacter dejongeii]